jgi:hypothetical protein
MHPICDKCGGEQHDDSLAACLDCLDRQCRNLARDLGMPCPAAERGVTADLRVWLAGRRDEAIGRYFRS